MINNMNQTICFIEYLGPKKQPHLISSDNSIRDITLMVLQIRSEKETRMFIPEYLPERTMHTHKIYIEQFIYKIG